MEGFPDARQFGNDLVVWTEDRDSVSAGLLTANGLAPQDPKESGIFTSLPAGQFTAILAGKNGGTGIGLIEVYNLK